MRKENGLWVAIDGPDAVGKTTQVKLVVEHLKTNGLKSVAVQEFSSSPVGQTIQDILSTSRFYALREDKKSPLADTLLLVTDLVYEIESTIVPTIKSGGIVVSDRGPASLVAYQAVRISERSDFSLDKAITWCQRALSQTPVKPDLTTLIVISEDEMARRVEQREHYPLSQSDLSFLRQVNKILPSTAIEFSRRYTLIDGEKSPSEVTAAIVGDILSRINKKQIL